jgi:hypothetical protein
MLAGVDNGEGARYKDTDLAKKFGNFAFGSVEKCDPNPHLKCKADEFREYVRQFGIARTVLSRPRFQGKTRILATATDEQSIYAAEIAGRLFFLPLKESQSLWRELPQLLTTTISSILAYKRRNEVYLPDWVEVLRFKREDQVAERITTLRMAIADLMEEARRWERYKTILVASGKVLNEAVVEVFRSFFALNLKSDEAYIEDAIIYDSKQKPIFVVEIKGVNAGIKREHINQVDSHRERLDMPPEIPGLLVINDFADTDGIDERKAKQIDPNHLKHAIQHNVKILRTTTLFEFMRAVEELSDRGNIFLRQCSVANPFVELPTFHEGA